MKFIFLFLMLTVLSGCQLFETDEAALGRYASSWQDKEEELTDIQTILVRNEQKENKLYSELTALTAKERAEIITLSNEAIESVLEREEKIKQEQKMLDEQLSQWKTVVNTMNANSSEKVKTAIAKWNSYHKSYASMLHEYYQSVQLDKDLFAKLRDEATTISQLEEHLAKVNSQYKVVAVKTNELNEQYEMLGEHSSDGGIRK